MFITELQKQITKKNSRLCVGLDPRLELLPKEITSIYFNKYGETPKAAALAITHFHKEVIDVITPHVPIIKPQSAFFEQFGPDGMTSLQETILYAKEKGLLVLLDVKRGDIDSTAQAYANAYLGKTTIGNSSQMIYVADAITVNPFLGIDTLEPFFQTAKKYGKGIFVLVKTSNSGSADFQDLKAGSQTVSERIALLLNKKVQEERGNNTYSNFGAVVGATFPDIAKKLRSLLPNSFFLVPGYGVQGAKLENLQYFFQKNGNGAIINASRSIVFSYKNNKGKDFRLIIKEEAEKTVHIINKALSL